MLNRCNNCGGELHYDIESKQLICIHCESTFDPEKNYSQTDANEQNELDITVYTCPTCGAEISSLENAAIDYCLYCGSFVTLKKKMGKIKNPDYIIPFSKSQNQCKESYKNFVRKKIYAPKEFRDDSFLEGFKGIYLPFWTYEYTYGPTVHIPGQKSERKGDYLHIQTYDISCHVEGSLKDIAYDASSNFDDQISQGIVPFSYHQRKDFNPSYMFGFYADNADVKAEVYEEDANTIARNEIWEELSSIPEIKAGCPSRPEKNSKLDSQLNLKRANTLTMLPVWFLTWKKGDRIAYSVMNGDNGKIYSEIPVSIPRYLIISLLSAIPIFFLLNLFVTFNAPNMLRISAFLSAVVMFLYSAQFNTIVRRKTHSNDKGYLHVYRKNEETEIHENYFVILWENMVGDIRDIGILSILLLIAGLAFMSEVVIITLIIVGFVFPFYFLWLLYKQGEQIQDFSGFRNILLPLLTYILSLVILFLDPASDIIYYGSAIFCLVAIGICTIQTMRKYNDMITRPIPHFFNRKAGK